MLFLFKKKENPLNKLINSLLEVSRKKIKDKLSDLIFIHSLDDFEIIMTSLLGSNKITIDDYEELRERHIFKNMYSYIFQIPFSYEFDEQWVQGHLQTLLPELIKPTKKLDKNYSRKYDFLYKTENHENVRIKVEAFRAVDFHSQELPHIKALTWDSKKPFQANLKQIRPNCWDVFILIGVWRDAIKYWLISSDEIKNNKYFLKKQGKENNEEWQLCLNSNNLKDFSEYSTDLNFFSNDILNLYKEKKINEIVS